MRWIMRWNVMPVLLGAGLLAGLAATAAAANRGDRDDDTYAVRDKEQIQRSIAFTGAGPRTLEVDNVFGSINVAAYDGQTVEVSATRTLEARTKELLERARTEVTLDIIEEPTRVTLFVDGPFRDCDCDSPRRRPRASGGASAEKAENANENADQQANADDSDRRRRRRTRHNGDPGYKVTYDFVIKVPRAAAIDLRTVTDGDIRVEGTGGDFNVQNVNGKIDMANVAGSGQAHTVNGPVTVVFRSNPTAASSFKSINGELAVYFDPSLDADLTMKTMNGDFFSDFETTQLAAVRPVVEERRNGKRIFHIERDTRVRIGRGGPVLRFETLNGDIRILHRGR